MSALSTFFDRHKSKLAVGGLVMAGIDAVVFASGGIGYATMRTETVEPPSFTLQVEAKSALSPSQEKFKRLAEQYLEKIESERGGDVPSSADISDLKRQVEAKRDTLHSASADLERIKGMIDTNQMDRGAEAVSCLVEAVEDFNVKNPGNEIAGTFKHVSLGIEPDGFDGSCGGQRLAMR